MTDQRFKVLQNRIGDWIVEDDVDDKYLLNIPKFIGFDDEESANVFCEELNNLHNKNQRIKYTLEKKEELLRDVLKVNDNMVKKIRELENDNAELKEAMKRMMGEMMSR